MDKRYYGYEGRYVVEHYITYKYKDTVLASSQDLNDVLAYMDDNDLWDDYYVYRIDEDGVAQGLEY